MGLTTTVRRTQVLAVLVTVAVSAPLLGGCTPRDGHAVLDNRTSSELVVLEGGRFVAGTADAGGTGSVWVGDPGDCIEGVVVVVTADGSRMATVEAPVCDEQTFVVEEAQLVPSGTVTLVNASSVSFDDGYAGATTVGALSAGDERVLQLPMPTARCLDLTVHLWALDGDSRPTAEATTAGHVCHGDRLVVAPQDVGIMTTAGWQWLEPRDRESLSGDPGAAAPPAPDGLAATVEFEFDHAGDCFPGLELVTVDLVLQVQLPGELCDGDRATLHDEDVVPVQHPASVRNASGRPITVTFEGGPGADETLLPPGERLRIVLLDARGGCSDGRLYVRAVDSLDASATAYHRGEVCTGEVWTIDDDVLGGSPARMAVVNETELEFRLDTYGFPRPAAPGWATARPRRTDDHRSRHRGG